MTADALIGVLLGGGVTLVAHTVIQLVIVPRVDARRRREDRWEQDVLILGELLTHDVRSAAESARHDQWMMNSIHIDLKGLTNVDPARVDQLKRDVHEKASQSTDRYKALTQVRIPWIGDRIVWFAPVSIDTLAFSNQLRAYQLTAQFCTIYDHPDDNFDEAKLEGTWQRERDKAKALTGTVTELARRYGLPRRMFGRRASRKRQATKSSR